MRIILIVVILSFSYSSHGQEPFNFSEFKPREINEIKEFEESIGSVFKTYTYFTPYYDESFSDMIPDVVSKAIIYTRKYSGFYPDLAIWYFFDQDSIVKGHFYSWSFYNPDFNPRENIEILETQYGRLKEYKKQYETVKSELIILLGNDYSEKLNSRARKNYLKSCTWDLECMRTVLVLHFDPTLTAINDPQIENLIVGGHSNVTIKTFYKKCQHPTRQ